MGVRQQQTTKYVGPWPDGVITRHEGSYDVAESYLSDCINFDVSDYGVLIQRPGFVRFHDADSSAWPANFTNSGPFRLLGSAPTGGNLRLYVSLLILTGGTWKERIYYTDDPTTGSLTQIIQNDHGAVKPPDTQLFSQAVLYNGKIYFIRRGQAGAGAFVNNVSMDNGDTTGASAAGTGAPGTGSQFGYYAFVMQDRMFVVDLNGSKVNYSKATDPTAWAAPDGGFFNVNPQSGQGINAVVALEDIVYIFKPDESWAFSFNTDPAVDGTLRVISRTYGAWDATSRGSEMFVVNRFGIFRFVDGNFIDIAQNVANILDSKDAWNTDACITVVGDRLIIGSVLPTGGAFTCLMMNLNTNAWTKYLPTDAVIGPTSKRSYRVGKDTGKTFMVWGDTPSAVGDVAGVAGGYFSMMRVGVNMASPDDKCRDQDRLGVVYAPTYTLVTVPIALDDPTRWKKLYRWRFDILQVDADSQDAKPVFSVRDGDPTVVDDSQTLTSYADFYADFFDSVVTKQQRFKVMQFGMTKASTVTDPQAGNNVAEQQTLRVRGLAMNYAVKGLIRS